MARTAPSIARLTTLKDVTPELAKHIRHIWKDATRAEIAKALDPILHHGFLADTNHGRMLWIDRVASYHGVEWLGVNRAGEDIDYLNAGDIYTATLVFTGPRLTIASAGDLIESGYVRKQKQQF